MHNMAIRVLQILNTAFSSYRPMFCHTFQLEFALAKYLELKMSAQRELMDSEASSQSLDSGAEGLRGSGPLSTLEKTKAKKQAVQAWNFQYTLQTDLWAKSVSQQMKKLICLLSTSKLDWVIAKPYPVHSVAVFCYFKSVLLPSTDAAPWFKLSVFGELGLNNR